jgi:hypothetical protein
LRIRIGETTIISCRKIPFGNFKDKRLETDSDFKGYPLLKGDLGKG